MERTLQEAKRLRISSTAVSGRVNGEGAKASVEGEITHFYVGVEKEAMVYRSWFVQDMVSY